MMNLRIGQGIDIHPFKEGRRCVLGGVEIPGAIGLDGHSDADALVHALIDAILGATGQRDIGTLFPDSDLAFKDADSCKLLQAVWIGLQREGWSLINADITVLAEVPKLKPYVEAMRSKLSAILVCEPACIAIKATTTEKMGFIGRKEGVLASAVVLVGRASEEKGHDCML
jgi:2-C-methyl-D-erythritol 2,4-cyclodiphosphate synthase